MNSSLSTTNRILSLDVFRGLTIVLMILVNSQGTNSPYALLAHADWNGCTFADVVFPSFLFIVGMSLCISLKKQILLKPLRSLYAQIFQRALILFVIGLLLNAIPFHFDLGTIRVFGILQRIAFCYLFGSLIYLHFNVKTQILIFVSILISYWVLLTQIPVPGYEMNQLTMEGNWVGFVDQHIFSSPHLLEKTFDPEGLLSTIPSIATTLMGILAGQLLLSSSSNNRKCALMAFLGGLCVVMGLLWDFNFPINKNLWTSSYVLLTGGISLLTFALCFLVIDIAQYKKWAWPLKVFGMNALFAFIFHVLLLKIQFMFRMPLKNGSVDNLKGVITEYLFGFCTSQNAALFYSILFLLINFAVVAYLYRNKLFIRI